MKIYKLPSEVQDRILYFLGSHYRIFLELSLLPIEVFLDGGYYTVVRNMVTKFGTKKDIIDKLYKSGINKKYIREYTFNTSKKNSIARESNIYNYLVGGITKDKYVDENILLENIVYNLKDKPSSYITPDKIYKPKDIKICIDTIPTLIHYIVKTYKDTNPKFISNVITLYNKYIPKHKLTNYENLKLYNYKEIAHVDMYQDCYTIGLFLHDLLDHGYNYTRNNLILLSKFNHLGMLADATIEVLDAIENKDENKLYTIYPEYVEREEEGIITYSWQYYHTSFIYFICMSKYRFVNYGDIKNPLQIINYIYCTESIYSTQPDREQLLIDICVYEPKILVDRVVNNIHKYGKDREDKTIYEVSNLYLKKYNYTPYEKIHVGPYIMDCISIDYLETNYYMCEYGNSMNEILSDKISSGGKLTWDEIYSSCIMYPHIDAVYECYKHKNINFISLGINLFADEYISKESLIWILYNLGKESIEIKKPNMENWRRYIYKESGENIIYYYPIPDYMQTNVLVGIVESWISWILE